MIPWDKIPKEYEYCAIDGGGCYEGVAWLYQNKPTEDEEGAWAAEGTLTGLTNFVDSKEVAGYLATHPQDSLIYRYDYEESNTMDADRDSIREDIRKRLVKIKGIGPEKAERGSDAVMEYLDGLVQQSQGTPKEGERDEDGIECVKRPEGIPSEYNYLYWGLDGHQRWVHHFKPTHFGSNNYTCRGINTDEYEEAHLRSFTAAPLLEDILPEERITKCKPEDRIVRLVD